MARIATQSDKDGIELEELESEREDRESSPASYEILTYPADYTLEVLVKKWTSKNIKIPKFQRKFVWKQTQSSKLIESFLLGLPVPPIFLYLQDDNRFLVVDGQQRLKTIAYFFEGYFGEETKGKRPVFRLTGLNDKSPFLNLSYAELEEADDSAFRRLNDAVLRSFVIKQLNPKDNTSIYHIFERLNTGGTFLHGQEIRNCIYHGKFNDLLHKLNKLTEWRGILGKPSPDRRQRDIELILRFFALSHDGENYEKPMKDFLSKYMAQARKTTTVAALKALETEFDKTVKAVHEHLGPKPFHVRAGLNIAVYDSVFPAFAANIGNIPSDIAKRYKKLLANETYGDYITSRTTNDEIVARRLALANKMLFGT